MEITDLYQGKRKKTNLMLSTWVTSIMDASLIEVRSPGLVLHFLNNFYILGNKEYTGLKTNKD